MGYGRNAVSNYSYIRDLKVIFEPPSLSSVILLQTRTAKQTTQIAAYNPNANLLLLLIFAAALGFGSLCADWLYTTLGNRVVAAIRGE